jgi:hypothetical protein
VDRPVSWTYVVRDGAVMRRAAVTSVVVGTILTLVNHGGELLSEGFQPGHTWQIALTYLVPFVVSLVSSAATLRSHGHDGQDRPEA